MQFFDLAHHILRVFLILIFANSTFDSDGRNAYPNLRQSYGPVRYKQGLLDDGRLRWNSVQKKHSTKAKSSTATSYFPQKRHKIQHESHFDLLGR